MSDSPKPPADGPTDPPPGAARRALDQGDDDLLVREEPLLIKLGEQQVLTMRTPGDDFHLAVGFLASEGVIDRPDAIVRHEFTAGDPGVLRADTIELFSSDTTSTQVEGRLTRTHEIRSSCGICGLTDPDELLEETRPLLPGVPRITTEQIEALRVDFETRQPLFAATGASHGAVLYDENRSPIGQGEDVGRHNALDKAIGQAFTRGHDLSRAIALLSGRAGYDLTFKCLRLGIPIILSISAASALSHDLCSAAGGTLVGFLREGRMKIYCDGGRLAGRSS